MTEARMLRGNPDWGRGEEVKAVRRWLWSLYSVTLHPFITVKGDPLQTATLRLPGPLTSS